MSIRFSHCELPVDYDELRRSGGGSNPIVIPLGLMLLALCFVALVFYKLKQSNIVACILIGMFVGGTGLGDSISRELSTAFIELGIILVLFMGGLEVDVPAFISRWRLVLLNGLGQILINLIVFCAIGIATGLTSAAADTIFFGLACTLSSTILVLGGLKDRQEMETVHGQVILGLMVLQDVTAVVSLLILSSFDPERHGGPSFGVQIGIMMGKFCATLLILYFLSRFVLNWWFKLFAVSGEMLFVGTVGYALGVAGLAGLAQFSPEIGGFFAGVSLSAVPYRLEIEHKVEPIKAFGVVLFFFMLGIDLDLDGESLKQALPWSTLLALLTVFVMPGIMWFLGYVSKFRSRTAFMMGIIINQISEFSLILAQLAHKYEVFTSKQFQVITFATVITLLFSSIGHVRADEIYDKMAPLLAFLDRRTTEEEAHDEEFGLEDHVVLLGFNETGLEIAEFYRHNNQDVLVIQLDPALHATFKKGYIPPLSRPIINPLPGDEEEEAADLPEPHLDPNKSFNLEGWDLTRGTASAESASGLRSVRAPSADGSARPNPAGRRSLDTGRRSFDASRGPAGRAIEGAGWGAPRRSVDQRRGSMDQRRSLEQARSPQSRGRSSLDQIRQRPKALDEPEEGAEEGSGKPRSSMKGTRRASSLDLPRRAVMIVTPMSPVIEATRECSGLGSTSSGFDASFSLTSPHKAPPLSPLIEVVAPARRTSLAPEEAGPALVQNGGFVPELAGIALPGAWLDPTAALPAEMEAKKAARNGFINGGARRGSVGSTPLEAGPPPEPSAAPNYDGIKFSTRGAAEAEGRRSTAESFQGRRSTGGSFQGERSMHQSFRDAMQPDRGSREGAGTNIYSVYADPESPQTWEHYQLSKAKIVFSCMVGGQAAEVYLSRHLKKEKVPFLAITNSNNEAKELYECGCRYVIQQEYLAAKVMKEILDDEIPKGKERAFDDKRREHKGELHDTMEDELSRQIHHFL